MRKFTARTRLRGEITYYHTEWTEGTTRRQVRFLEGPHAGNTYPEDMCAIAKDEEQLLRKQNERWRVRKK